MMNDNLRNNIRNPLFHQGEIPDLPIQDKIKLFKDYYGLLMRIVLRILRCDGEYRSIKTGQTSIP